MGGALYKSVKKRGGALSSVSVFNHKRAPMSRYSHSMSSKQISGQATTHNEATSQGLMAQQHSEQHHITMIMV